MEDDVASRDELARSRFRDVDPDRVRGEGALPTPRSGERDDLVAASGEERGRARSEEPGGARDEEPHRWDGPEGPRLDRR